MNIDLDDPIREIQRPVHPAIRTHEIHSIEKFKPRVYSEQHGQKRYWMACAELIPGDPGTMYQAAAYSWRGAVNWALKPYPVNVVLS